MKLRVKARGLAMVPDIDAMEAGHKRFIGRRLDTAYGPDKVWAFVPVEGEEGIKSLPAYAEYVRSVKEGDLWAADEATAVYCGVVFDPDFGAPKAEKAEKAK